jgi:hypothetical protein
MTFANDIDIIYNSYLSVQKLHPRHEQYSCITLKEDTEASDLSSSVYSQVKRINIFIKTQSGTIENRYSADVTPGSVNKVNDTVTIIGNDSEFDKSIQVVLSKDNPTSVIVQGTESEHPDLVRFENDLSFFQRDDPQELNIFINE